MKLQTSNNESCNTFSNYYPGELANQRRTRSVFHRLAVLTLVSISKGMNSG
jgi:hypothetical protein